MIPDTFLISIVYQITAMLFALVAYGWLAINHQLSGAGLMAAGILVTILAAGVQAGQSVSFTFIWKFDHNGAYHLIQMVGVILLTAGLRSSFLFLVVVVIFSSQLVKILPIHVYAFHLPIF
jgi:hypothetical protein